MLAKSSCAAVEVCSSALGAIRDTRRRRFTAQHLVRLREAYQGVPVGTIKRHATGKGNAPKEAMIAAARAHGFSPADDNEADAIALLLWAIETGGGVA